VTQLEKDIEKKLRLMVESYGGLCLKWVCPGWSGVPDRILLLPGGHVIFAETKRPKGGKLSRLQKWWLDKLQSMGFLSGSVWSEADVVALEQFIKGLLAGKPDPHKPLTRKPGESEDDFTDRVVWAVCHDDLTPNAGRASLGRPPIEKETTTC
jgi:hypothetical protein